MITRELQNTLNEAYNDAMMRRHEYLTLEHLLLSMLKEKTASEVLVACGGDLNAMARELVQYLTDKMETLPSHVNAMPEQTATFERVVERAILQAQSAGQPTVDSGNLIAAMFQERRTFAVYLLEKYGISRLDVLNFISHGIAKFGSDDFNFAAAGAGAQEGEQEGEGGAARKPVDPLESFAIDLLKQAQENKIDPLIGREDEVKRTIQVLCRRRKNNPILVGEAGVGKTAIAEGLALKIFRGEVPKALRASHVYALDLSAIVAGSRFRGDFEQRLKAVIKELLKLPGVILFIDEIHTIVRAGAVEGGAMDASNILKPVLASGELRCIGSTTYSEYKASFEKDKALARRFQKIEVQEPSVADTIKILKGLAPLYEKFHGVKFYTEAIELAAELSARHINDRFLPDKAIDVLDETGARVRLRESAKDEEAESAAGAEAASAAGSEAESAAAPEAESAAAPVAASAAAPVTESAAESEEAVEEKIYEVTTLDVEQTVASMAKIPTKTVSGSDKSRLKLLESDLKAVIFGQDQAIEQMVRAIKLSRSGLGHPDKPIASFLCSGPTGVGKTELAKQLAAAMGVNFLRFDMSEYMEKHTVSRLIGAPPGYVGFDQGGLLTDAVTKTPHCVVLLDEIEKAHPDVFNILLQVMDHAALTDNNGKKADFRNVILIMTTNAGARDMMGDTIGFGANAKQSLAEGLAQEAARSERERQEDSGLGIGKGRSAIERTFSPEFRNRLDAWIAFNPLTYRDILKVVDKFIGEVRERLSDKDIPLTVTESARSWFAENGYDRRYGARPMARLIKEKISAPLADEILFGMLVDGGSVKVDMTDGELTVISEGNRVS